MVYCIKLLVALEDRCWSVDFFFFFRIGHKSRYIYAKFYLGKLLNEYKYEFLNLVWLCLSGLIMSYMSWQCHLIHCIHCQYIWADVRINIGKAVLEHVLLILQVENNNRYNGVVLLFPHGCISCNSWGLNLLLIKRYCEVWS